MLLQMALFYSFLRLSDIPLGVYIYMCVCVCILATSLSILLSMAI